MCFYPELYSFSIYYRSIYIYNYIINIIKYYYKFILIYNINILLYNLYFYYFFTYAIDNGDSIDVKVAFREISIIYIEKC